MKSLVSFRKYLWSITFFQVEAVPETRKAINLLRRRSSRTCWTIMPTSGSWAGPSNGAIRGCRCSTASLWCRFSTWTKINKFCEPTAGHASWVSLRKCLRRGGGRERGWDIGGGTDPERCSAVLSREKMSFAASRFVLNISTFSVRAQGKTESDKWKASGVWNIWIVDKVKLIIRIDLSIILMKLLLEKRDLNLISDVSRVITWMQLFLTKNDWRKTGWIKDRKEFVTSKE